MKSQPPRLTSKQCPVVYPRLGPGLGRNGKGNEPFLCRRERAATPFEVVDAMTHSTQDILTCPVYDVAPVDDLLHESMNENSALSLLNALAQGRLDLLPLAYDSDEDEDEDLGIDEEEEDLDFDDDEEDELDDEEAGDVDTDELEDDDDEDDEDDDDDFWDDEDEEEEELFDDDDEDEELFDDEEEDD